MIKIKLFEDWEHNYTGSTINVKKEIDHSNPWTTSGNQYLINKNAENLDLVKQFVEYFNLTKKIIDIWLFSKKNYNIYPDKITTTEIIYLISDYKIIIKIENKEISTIQKVKIEYKNNSFKAVVLDEANFSFDKFKYFLK